MEAVREKWTDERLDDLTHRVDEGFNRTEREFQAMRVEMRTEFGAVRSEMKTEFGAVRSEMRTEFGAVRSEMKSELGAVRSEMRTEIGGIRADLGGQIAALHRTLLQIAAGGFITLCVAIGATQL
jgi:hypothetical protein